MNENIGAKGQGNDLRRRSNIIMKKQEKILKELDLELKKAEKEARKHQLHNMITLVPLVMSLKTMQVLINNSSKKPTKEELEGKKSTIIDKENDFDELGNSIRLTTGELINQKYKLGKNVITNPKEIFTIGTKELETIGKQNNFNKDPDIKQIISNQDNRIEIGVQKQNNIPIKETTLEEELSVLAQEKLEKLKSLRIIDEYEKELKDVRLELRKTIYEYNVIVEETVEVYDSKEAQELIDKLNYITKKIEKLKKSINIEDYDKYDNNYLYVLIEDYLAEFNNKKPIKEIKDSPLYIEISSKINELDSKKDLLSKKLIDKKEKLEIDEEKLDELKDSYYNFDKLNNDLLKFQKEQEAIIVEMNDKIDKSTEVIERVQTEVQAFNGLSRNLLRYVRRGMLIPGVRSARAIMAGSALSLFLMNRIVNPRITSRTYKEIKVTDYSKSIESNITSIDKNQNLLKKNFKELDRIIKEFSEKYKKYFGKVKECDKLLSDLEKVRDSLKEKEYELDRIKDLQVKALERNNTKVKTLR